MNRTQNIAVMVVLALLAMGGYTGGSWVGDAGERGARVEGEGVGESGERSTPSDIAQINDLNDRKIGDKNEIDLSDQTIIETKLEVVKDGFLHLSDVYVSPSGLIYAVDAMRHYLYRLDPVAGVIDSVGGRGQGMTQFWGPVSVHATNDLKIFVQDAGNGRIQMFDRRFQFLGSLVVDGGPVVVSDDPTVGMVVNRAGGIVYWDVGGSNLVGTTATYTIDRTFNPDLSEIQLPPKKIRKSPDGFIVIDNQGQILHRFADNGRRIGFLSGYGNLIDITTQESGMFILTPEFIISTTTSGIITQVIRHLIQNPITIVRHQSSLYVTDRTTLYRVVI